MTSAEYGRRTIAIRERFERYATALMKRYFARQMADVRADMEAGRNPFDNWDKWDRELSDWVEPKIRTAIKVVYQNTSEYMKVDNEPNDVLVVFKAGEVMSRLAKVNDTTREKIEAIINQPRSRAVSDNVQSAIDEVMLIFNRFIASRSPVIGLTLATASTGQGVDMAMQDNYKELYKTWRAFIDKDTRDGHEAADGQTVHEGQPFIVQAPDGTFENLRWPGDPYASPGNIINCRCYIEPSME